MLPYIHQLESCEDEKIEEDVYMYIDCFNGTLKALIRYHGSTNEMLLHERIKSNVRIRPVSDNEVDIVCTGRHKVGITP